MVKFTVGVTSPTHRVGELIAGAGLLDAEGQPSRFLSAGTQPPPSPDGGPAADVCEQLEVLTLAILAERSGVDARPIIDRTNARLLSLAGPNAIPDAESCLRSAIAAILGRPIHR